MYTNPIEQAESAKRMYEDKKADRDQFLLRSYEYAKLTLKYLLPDQTSDTSGTSLVAEYTSEGAMGVNHLANKYMAVLYPPARNFFRLDPTPEFAAQLAQEGAVKSKTDLEEALSIIERRAKNYMNTIKARPVLLEDIKHDIVTGNSCLYLPEKGTLQTYALDQYVQTFNFNGDLLELIIQDKTYLRNLSAEVQALVIRELGLKPEEIRTKIIDMYTYVCVTADDQDKFQVTQSAESIPLPTVNTYKRDDLPWMPQFWHRIRRENYGRGLIEDLYPELFALSMLSEAAITGAAIASDVKFIVDPAAGIDVAQLNASASGTYHVGKPDGITPMQFGKAQDYQLINYLMEKYRQILGKAFMNLQSTMRDAERVTAEENRLRAREIESTHAGVYSSWALTKQLPIVNLILARIDMRVDDRDLEVVITTGLDAMGRDADTERLLLVLQDLKSMNDLPEDVRGHLNLTNLIKRFFIGRDVDSAELILTEKEYNAKVAAQNQQAQQVANEQALLKGASPEASADALQA